MRVRKREEKRGNGSMSRGGVHVRGHGQFINKPMKPRQEASVRATIKKQTGKSVVITTIVLFWLLGLGGEAGDKKISCFRTI